MQLFAEKATNAEMEMDVDVEVNVDETRQTDDPENTKVASHIQIRV